MVFVFNIRLKMDQKGLKDLCERTNEVFGPKVAVSLLILLAEFWGILPPLTGMFCQKKSLNSN